MPTHAIRCPYCGRLFRASAPTDEEADNKVQTKLDLHVLDKCPLVREQKER